MRLSVGVIGLGLLVGTLFGPLTVLAEPPESGFLVDQDFWVEVAEDTVSSFANSALAVIGVVGAAYGLPMMRGSKEPEVPVDERPV